MSLQVPRAEKHLVAVCTRKHLLPSGVRVHVCGEVANGGKAASTLVTAAKPAVGIARHFVEKPTRLH